MRIEKERETGVDELRAPPEDEPRGPLVDEHPLEIEEPRELCLYEPVRRLEPQGAIDLAEHVEPLCEGRRRRDDEESRHDEPKDPRAPHPRAPASARWASIGCRNPLSSSGATFAVAIRPRTRVAVVASISTSPRSALSHNRAARFTCAPSTV